MPDQSAQIVRPVTDRSSRKELLILACAIDRATWRKTYQVAARPRVNPIAGEVIGYLELLSSFLPGRIGRWLRGANFVAQLGRTLGWLRL